MKSRIIRLKKSFSYAKEGIWHTFLTQPNMWIHSLFAGIAVVFAFVFDFSSLEWAILSLVIFFVFVLEVINTVAEIIVDIASPDFSDLARIAKDVSAGAVLIGAIGSIVVGSFLYVPKIIELL